MMNQDARRSRPPRHEAGTGAASTIAGAGCAGRAMVPAVARALALLELVAGQRRPLTLTAIHQHLRLPKSSLHGLCQTLAQLGYLVRDDDGSYAIGGRVAPLADAFAAGQDVAGEFHALLGDRPVAREVSVVLAVLDGAEARLVAARNAMAIAGMEFAVGSRRPAWQTATGRTILAASPPARVSGWLRDILRGNIQGCAPGDVGEFIEELALVRRRGYCTDEDAMQDGVVTFAAPVQDARGRVVAGLGVCVDRLQLVSGRSRRHRDDAVAIARALSLRLGASEDTLPRDRATGARLS